MFFSKGICGLTHSISIYGIPIVVVLLVVVTLQYKEQKQ